MDLREYKRKMEFGETRLPQPEYWPVNKHHLIIVPSPPTFDSSKGFLANVFNRESPILLEYRIINGRWVFCDYQFL